MQINPINTYSFGANNPSRPSQQEKNPISKTGEKAKLAKATFIAGLGVGTKLLFELVDDFDLVGEKIGKKASDIVNKQHKNVNANKKVWLTVGAWIGLLTTFVAGFAFLYTLFKAPKINYEENINAHKKSKEMDVYIKGNDTEKELYTQMNEKAKNATDEEKSKLKTQYMQMQMAKNKVPDFVKLK